MALLAAYMSDRYVSPLTMYFGYSLAKINRPTPYQGSLLAWGDGAERVARGPEHDR